METEVNILKREQNKVGIQITVPAEEVEKAIAKKINELSKSTNFPGFRKGMVPRIIVERTFGMDNICGRVMHDLLPNAYIESINKLKLRPFSEPEFDFEPLIPNQPYTFKANVEVYPEVLLGEYKGIKVKKIVEDVKSEDIEKAIENLREFYATYKTVDELPASLGNVVIFDYKIVCEGKDFESKNKRIELGKNLLLPEIEEKIVGMKKGEEKSFEFKYPDNYNNKNFAGKNAKITVKINDVQEKKLPEIDDKFLKMVGGYKDIEQLKNYLERRIKENNELESEKKCIDEIIQTIIDNSQVEISKSMIENELEKQMNSLEMNLQKEGITLDDYINRLGMDLETLKMILDSGLRGNLN